MRAAVLRGPGDLVVLDVEAPTAGPHDIVVRVDATGICGSDLASYATGAYVPPGQVMGHEFAGSVVEVGAEVVGLVPEQRVTVHPLGRCDVCRACLHGLPHVCDRAVKDAIGYGHPGAFAEYVRVPQAVLDDNVFSLAPEIDDAAAATVEPFAVALHACRRLALTSGQTCVVLGLGPIGHAAVQVLHALGIDNVVGVDASAFRRERALAAGAAAVSGSDEMLDVTREIAGPGPRGRGAGADAVLDASGSVDLLRSAISLLRSGGQLAPVALYKKNLDIELNELVTRELGLIGCYGYGPEFGEALDMVREDRLRPGLMVTAAYDLGSVVSAFDAQADVTQHIKVQVRPQL